MQSGDVVTDTRSVQKETSLHRVPTMTIRPESESVESVDVCWNVTANDVDVAPAVVSHPSPLATRTMPHGDGNAAGTVVKELLRVRS